MRERNIAMLLFFFLCYLLFIPTDVLGANIFFNDYGYQYPCPLGEICVEKCCTIGKTVRDGVCQNDTRRINYKPIRLYSNRTVPTDMSASLQYTWFCAIPLVQLNNSSSGNAVRVQLDRSLYSEVTNSAYGPYQYCIDFVGEKDEIKYYLCTESAYYNVEENHFYLATTSLNVVLQLILCVVFVISKKYEKLGGKLLLLHIFMFLIGNVAEMSLSSVQGDDWASQRIVVLTIYLISLASSFSWFTIFCFNVWLEFSQAKITYIFYDLYVWTTFVILLINCASFTYTRGTLIPYSFLIVYAVLNTIFYIGILIYLFKNMEKVKHALLKDKSTEGWKKNRINKCLRLLALFCLNWCFYIFFFANFLNIPQSMLKLAPIIEIVYHIVIFYLYAWNTKVFKSVRQIFCKI